MARTLAQQLVGRRLGTLWHSHKRLRREVDYSGLKGLEGKGVSQVVCYGKVLFIHVDEKPAMVAQLGMTGQLAVVPTDTPIALHTHVRWPLKDKAQELRYVDPRRFGLIDVCDEKGMASIIEALGPDPFSMDAHQKSSIISSIQRSHRNVKEVLLDQRVMAGVGNIYASEALFLAKIDPKRRGADLSTQECGRLVEAVITVLESAYKNCGTTFSNYVDGSGNKGNNLAFLQVFQRHQEPCPVCRKEILRIKQGGRSTFYCDRCQK